MQTGVFVGREYSYLIPLLLSKKRIGQVHSIFQNGFNVLMGDSLIFIGSTKNGLLPFGIHLDDRDVSRIISLVNIQEPVRWNSEALTLEFRKMSVSIAEGKSFKNEVIPLKNNRDLQTGFDRLFSLLISLKEPTGLDIYIHDFIQKFDYVGKKKTKTEESLIQLIHVAMSSDVYVMEKTLRFFLGRGKGLTPSGDDLLIGFLAFNSIANFVSPLLYKQLSSLIEHEMLTTDVSKEYLRYALTHEFSSTVADVVNSLSNGSRETSEKTFRSLLEVGHSSGLDTLFGIFIGMLAFKNPLEQ